VFDLKPEGTIFVSRLSRNSSFTVFDLVLTVLVPSLRPSANNTVNLELSKLFALSAFLPFSLILANFTPLARSVWNKVYQHPVIVYNLTN